MPKAEPHPLHNHVLVIGETGKYSLRAPEKPTNGNRSRMRKKQKRWGDDIAIRVHEIPPAPAVTCDRSERQIYVIGPHNGYVKIGMALDAEARRYALQTAWPVDLFIHFVATVDAERIREIERACHDDLAQHRLRGEWFDVPLDKAVETVRRNVRGFMGIHFQF